MAEINKRKANGLGQFERGNKASPGRPRGSRNVRTLLMMEALQPHAGPLLIKAINMALAGDVQCLLRLLDRVLPPGCRSTPIVFDLGDGTLVEKSQRIIDGMTSGVLAPEEGKALSDALQTHSNVSALPDLAARLEELESRLLGAKR